MDSDKLPTFILILIISHLPFKDALRTSILSKRWENLHRETTNISFKDTEFVTGNDLDEDETVRDAFMFYVSDWVSRFAGPVIETFELCFVKPVGYETQIKSVIEFVVSKKVKNLVLDFSEPRRMMSSDVEPLEASMFSVPESFYSLTTLESLKLSFCSSDPSKLESPGSLKSLCVCWIELKQIMSLISKTPLLESLRIKNCRNVGLEAITGVNNRLYKLVLKYCHFNVVSSKLDVPNIKIFKYFGTLHSFVLVRVNTMMEEVYLDFWEQTEYDEDTETQLRGLLYKFASAKMLTVSPFVLRMIQNTDDQIHLQAQMKTQQLVLKTIFRATEFVGIKLMINSCPNLELLAFHLVGIDDPQAVVAGFDPDTYWTVETNHRCLKNTLKAIEMWSFYGNSYELHMLRFLIKYGLVLERVNLYLPLPFGVDKNEIEVARAASETVKTFQAGSRRLNIYVHNG